MNPQRILFFSIMLALSSTNLFAQNDTLKHGVWGAFVVVPIEFPSIDNAGINQALGQFGYPASDYPVASYGIGLQLHTNRFITTFSFKKTAKKKSRGAYETEVEYRSTSFNVGYDLIKDYRYSVYPFIGFKGCGLNYSYRERTSAELSLEDYFQTDLEYKEITTSRAHLDIGLGLSTQWFYLVNVRGGEHNNADPVMI